MVFHGSSLLLVYTIASFCIKKISKNYLNPPSLPRIVVWVTSPFALFNTVHVLVGIIAHIAITRKTNDERRLSFFDGEREVKRICIEANGYPVDGLIVGRRDRLDNGRWIIYSNGNGEHFNV